MLRGCLRTLKRHKPIVAFEHGHAGVTYFGTSAARIYELLCDEVGLKIFDFDGNGPFTLRDFQRASFPEGKLFNFFARP